MIRAIISSQFRKPAGWLGRIVSKLLIKGNSFEYDRILDELEIKPNDKLFEIGYGPGIGIEKICSFVDCHIEGVDFSELMFKQASERNRIHIESNKAVLSYGDFLDYPLSADQYDKIFCLNVIYFWDNLFIPFTKIRLALKAGGRFCFSMADKDHLDRIPFTSDQVFNKYSIDEVINQLKLAGFTDVHYKFDLVYFVKCRK